LHEGNHTTFNDWLQPYNRATMPSCHHAINHVAVHSFKGATSRSYNRLVMHATVHAAGKPCKQTMMQTTSNNLKQQ
jgi:hypothetical protein